MGNDTLPSKQTTGIAGSIPLTTVTQQISNTCNKHVTPAPDSAIGTVKYYYDPSKENSTAPWLSRHFDFLNRHKGCKHQVPEYYLGYGYKYISRFTNELYPKLSMAGKKWLIDARRLLQEYMENGFKDNVSSTAIVTKCMSYPDLTVTTTADATESLELVNSKFTEFAFNTHPAAYVDGGLGKLTLLDLIKISTTPDWGDLFSKNGLKQIKEIIGFLLDIKLEEAKKDPKGFMKEHAKQVKEVVDYYALDPVKNRVNDTIDEAKQEIEKKTGEILKAIVEQGKDAVVNEIKRRLNKFFDIPFPSLF